MKNIKDIGAKECVHCPTPELAKKIIESNGETCFADYEPDVTVYFCYIPKEKVFFSYADAIEQGYKIHSAFDFLSNQDENTYTKEDMKKAYEHGMFSVVENGHGDTFEKWFETFKK